jgi:hypothetical protein
VANIPSESCSSTKSYTTAIGFEQVLEQLQQLEELGLGHQPWEALRVIVEENRAEVNFELVERLAEREQRDWTYFGRFRHEREKKLRDPQDVLIEADRLRQRLKKRQAKQRGTPQQEHAAHCVPCPREPQVPLQWPICPGRDRTSVDAPKEEQQAGSSVIRR